MAHTVRFLKAALACIILFPLTTGAADAATFSSLLSEERLGYYRKADLFLKNLGFDDFVSEISATLNQNENITDVSRLALKKITMT